MKEKRKKCKHEYENCWDSETLQCRKCKKYKHPKFIDRRTGHPEKI